MISFSKYSGCGNDFLLIDDRQAVFPRTDLSFVRKACDQFAVDGIILLEHGKNTPYAMSTLNRDGSFAEMCGNGLRCLARFIQEKENPSQPFTVEVTNKTYKINIRDERISVVMPPPSCIEWDIILSENNQSFLLDYLDTGVPHIIYFVENVETVDLKSLGPMLRHHPRFAPRGSNVNFVSPLSNNLFAIRTYERGVEAETLACGTGATAAAIAIQKKFSLQNPIELMTRSNEKLTFYIEKQNGIIDHILMEGPAKKIFDCNFPILELN